MAAAAGAIGQFAQQHGAGVVVTHHQQHHSQFGVHPAITGASAYAVHHPQPQAKAYGGHCQQGGKAQKLAGHEQKAVAFGHRARRHLRQIDVNARQVKQTSKPAGHKNNVQGFDPEHAGSV